MFKYSSEVTEEEINSILKSSLSNLLENSGNKILLSQSDISSVKKRWEEGIFSLYEEAKRKHESIINTGMPWWGWLAIIYTGYDDVFRLITSSIFFPILIIVGLYFVLNYLGMTGPINQVKFLITDFITKLIMKKKFN